MFPYIKFLPFKYQLKRIASKLLVQIKIILEQMNNFKAQNYTLDNPYSPYRHTFDFNGKNAQNFPDPDLLQKQKAPTMKKSMMLPGQQYKKGQKTQMQKHLSPQNPHYRNNAYMPSKQVGQKKQNLLQYQITKTQSFYEKDTNNIKLHQKIDRLAAIVEKHQKKIEKLQNSDFQNLKKVMLDVPIIKNTTHELEKYVNVITCNINTLREEIKSLCPNVDFLQLKNALEFPIKKKEQKYRLNTDLETKAIVHQFQNFKKQIETKFEQFHKQVKNQVKYISEELSSIDKLKWSNLKFTGQPIIIKYTEMFKITNKQNGNKEIVVGQSQYFIDKDGYLMDQENRYLLDNRGNQIKLSINHINLLKKHNILQ